jgi:hypothetical protein
LCYYVFDLLEDPRKVLTVGRDIQIFSKNFKECKRGLQDQKFMVRDAEGEGATARGQT